MRLRKIPGIEEEFVHFPHLIVDHSQKPKGKWQEYFGNDNEICLEVGMGRGKFIDTMSMENPQVNFVAMELRNEMVYDAAVRIGNHRKNVAILREDATMLGEWFENGEVQRLYLNFSDPWPKKRHGKRRLTHENFLQRYRDILTDDGEIFFRTDVRSLMEFTLTEMTNHGFSLMDVSLDFHNSPFFDNVTTEYEDKKSKHGVIYYARFTQKK